MSTPQNSHIRWFETLKSNDVAIVGGKNASLGEMIASLKDKGIRAADAYWQFLTANQP
ncbi:phosphoenolpyruvate synthase [Nodularia spumigena CS-584]|jgi:pyruvate, water dikinase|uniref:Phosphoenolpyruvate synthase n=1 Tax=Nodularia spumigena UHCC 0060 TaxID=3110300 RepID=A0ABU5UMB9_NODSP|nr:hypothetical protein [Nodularia spumigena]AHJ30090.1 Phosphoenolpyruvate synthase [Nodularia spumigena CCY9414]EAW43063.1 Phosphoenolpyruvate synthase [Nodularia spumigena CCY9414]MDB9384411.1 phosphoenolpyruvate synthase [Nodularia spumigena CS-584]MEA5523443.1 phosphoenolpyruvate synthase [Nodularia spumigena UHCC 0143]MEA5557825.1 phosphoenolpyruvate synthase [Nodularia spumigena CH309]